MRVLPWIPEPSRRFNLLFTVEGSGIQGNEGTYIPNIHNSSTLSHPSEEENRKRTFKDWKAYSLGTYLFLSPLFLKYREICKPTMTFEWQNQWEPGFAFFH
jgi:hypothetical protein